MDFSKYGIRPTPCCESCEFYEYDGDLDDYVCQLSLDEDERYALGSYGSRGCHYYRYYDEYKSVHRQI